VAINDVLRDAIANWKFVRPRTPAT